MLQWLFVNDAGQNGLDSLAGAWFHFFSFSDDFHKSFCEVYVLDRIRPDRPTYGERTIACFTALRHCDPWERHPHIDLNFDIFFLLQLLRLLLPSDLSLRQFIAFLFVFLVFARFDIGFDDFFNLTA